MNLRRVTTLFRRDLVDAIRDGRILVAVLLPVALAIYYAAVMPDPGDLPDANLVVAGAAAPEFVDAIEEAADGSVELEVQRDADADARALRSKVEDDDGAVAVLLPASLGDGRGEIQLFVARDSAQGAALVAQIVAGVASRTGADEPPVTVAVTEVGPSNEAPFDRLGLSRASVIFSIAMLSAFIAFLAVPVLLMEEATLRTLEALQLVATTAEIIVAKVLVGLTYCAVAIGIVLATADLDIQRPLAFVGVALLISLVLVGYGLAFGLALGDPGRVNTWSGVILLPLLIPVFIALGPRESWSWAVDVFPTAGGAQLLAETMDPASIDLHVFPIAMLAVWGVAGFVLLYRLLDRRSA